MQVDDLAAPSLFELVGVAGLFQGGADFLVGGWADGEDGIGVGHSVFPISAKAFWARHFGHSP